MQGLSGAVEADTDAGRYRLQTHRFGGIERLFEILPDRRILGPHAPKGIALRPIGLRHLDLVEHCGHVQEPDNVFAAVVVHIGEVGIEIVLIEADLSL